MIEQEKQSVDQNHDEDTLDNSTSGAEEVNDNSAAKELLDKVQNLEQEKLELNDKLLRMLAELENVRKRSQEEVRKSEKFAISNFVSDLVLVVENLFLASENAPKEEIEKSALIKNYAQAVEMTEKELIKILSKYNVKRICPLGQQFDHNLHEAIAQIDSDEEEGIVVKVIQSGYSIADRLIRPALVSVSRGNSSDS